MLSHQGSNQKNKCETLKYRNFKDTQQKGKLQDFRRITAKKRSKQI